MEGGRGAISRYLGLARSDVEHCSEAATHFEDGMATNERMGARPWLAHTQDDYARMLLDRGHADTRLRRES